jgi:hypothetical protein
MKPFKAKLLCYLKVPIKYEKTVSCFTNLISRGPLFCLEALDQLLKQRAWSCLVLFYRQENPDPILFIDHISLCRVAKDDGAHPQVTDGSTSIYHATEGQQ